MQQSSHDSDPSIKEKCMQQSSHGGDSSIMERVHRLRNHLQMLRNQYPDKIDKNVTAEALFKGFPDWDNWDDWNNW